MSETKYEKHSKEYIRLLYKRSEQCLPAPRELRDSDGNLFGCAPGFSSEANYSACEKARLDAWDIVNGTYNSAAGEMED